MSVACFWLSETGLARVGLRRYVRSADEAPRCPLPMGYHAAVTYIGEAPLPRVEDEYGGHWGSPEFVYPGHDDPRWPAACECGHAFSETDPWQEWSVPLYCRADTGETLTLRQAPDGAMWDAWWYPWKGPDGRRLEVKCPGGGSWIIDGRASNCTLPKDTEHRCWVRHGEPPRITVDKNGKTCAAGAGSIIAGNYHGFLRGGVFT